MIIRILDDGQFDVPESAIAELNQLDVALETAIESGDSPAFRAALKALIERVRSVGSPVDDDDLAPSDLVFPGEDATLAEVSALLTEEGLIPG